MSRPGAFALAAILALVAACSSSSTSSPAQPDTTADAGGAADAGDDAAVVFTSSCTSARKQLLVPVDQVSSGAVSVVSDTGGVKTIYVDASAGGPQAAAKKPRVYVNLERGARVDVTDDGSLASADWDLALKRTVIFTNGGDGGPGKGEAAQLSKTFANVAAADADGAKLASESFFDADCNPKTDPIGAPLTTFSDWYDYDQATNIPTPKDVTYVVVGGSGKRYKVGIKAYDALPDGGSRNNQSTGYYLLEVSAL